MNSHDFTLSVYILIALSLVALELASRGAHSRVPPIGVLFSRAMRTRSGRVGVMAGWVWLGLHFFAR